MRKALEQKLVGRWPTWFNEKCDDRHRMDFINNKEDKIGSLTTAVSNDKSITINQTNDVTIVSTRDRNRGRVTTEAVFGDSPFGKEVDCSPQTNAVIFS